MKDPGLVAQGRALARLAQENRELFRRIYSGAPDRLARHSRRSWALIQLSHECPDRYREIFTEVKTSLSLESARQTIDPDKVGKASAPGPWHAVLTGGSITACGRTRFQIFTLAADRQVNCAYCLEEHRERRGRAADPQFGGHAADAESRIRDFADLQERAASARVAVLDALSPLRTPPIGTVERQQLADLLSQALGAGLTLREIGAQMGISGERVRQITADQEAAAS